MSYVESIQYDNKALQFIDKRLQDDNYRGSESSEHNRYDMEEIYIILTILNKYSPQKEKLQIPIGDVKDGDSVIVGTEKYIEICKEIGKKIKKKNGEPKHTQNTLKKNTFVDLHRAGFITRWKKTNSGILEIDPYKRSLNIKYVSLTDDGLKFINSNLIDRPFIFTKGLYNLLGNYIDISLDILKDSDCEIDKISKYEFMFFVSAINTDTSFSITKDECVSLLKDYRTLDNNQQGQVIERLKDRLKPEYFDGDKTQKRDWHNWKNKIDQIYHLFAQMPYFEIIDKDLTLTSRPIKKQKGADLEIKKRSQTEKLEYFKQHDILSKVNGYELHHVIALAFSVSPEQYEMLDKWENMVYIDAGQHAKITQNNNRNIIMSVEEADVILKDYINKNSIYLEWQTNILYSPDNQKIMLEYNKKMLKNIL